MPSVIKKIKSIVITFDNDESVTINGMDHAEIVQGYGIDTRKHGLQRNGRQKFQLRMWSGMPSYDSELNRSIEEV